MSYKKAMHKIISLTAGILLCVFYGHYIYEHKTTLDINHLLTLKNSILVFICSIFYLITFYFSAYAWGKLITINDVSPSTRTLYGIIASTQIVKYVPGNFFQHIARAALAKNKSIKIRTYAKTMILETLLAILACLIIGILYAYYKIFRPNDFGLSLCVFIVIGISCFYYYSKKYSNKSTHLYSNSAIALAIYFTNFVVIGASAHLLALQIDIDIHLFETIAIFAIAWAAGFLTIGAPAGMGSREAVLIILLNQYTSSDQAIAIGILTRLMTIIGDGLSAPLGYLALRKQGKKK